MDFKNILIDEFEKALSMLDIALSDKEKATMRCSPISLLAEQVQVLNNALNIRMVCEVFKEQRRFIEETKKKAEPIKRTSYTQ